MEEFTLKVEHEPDKKDMEHFWSILREYNDAKAGPSNFQPLVILLRDKDGNVVGGLNGETYWNWLYVENVAVRESLRRLGFGSRMLLMAEQEAAARGCKYAYLSTYSFQSLMFYERRGYSVFGVLEDFPEGHKRFFLRKALALKPST
jgi:GNAT superfamily N-acetyltransferase